jgi:hypothetical protein
MVRCYDHESARMTKNGAIITEDTSIEVYRITKRANFTIDLFYLMKRGDGCFKVELTKLY